MCRLLILSLTATAALAVSACDERPADAPPRQASASGERLTLATRTVEDLKPVAATVTTKDTAEARARIGGTLAWLEVKEGDRVRKGQTIALVTDPRLGLATSAYAAQVAAAQAEAERAGAELKRVRTLHEKGVYAAARLEQAEAASRAAQGQLDAVRAERAAAAELVGQGAILAPADGRVLRAETPAGSVVGQGQSVATITSGPPLVRLEMPEAQARALRVGEAISIVTEDLPGISGQGTIEQVYPSVTAGRVAADIRVAGLDAGLVGQRVRVRVKVGQRQALVLPRRFVATRFGVDFVRVAGREGAAEVAVQLAPGPSAGEVEVLSGLSAGDVVVAPARTLAQGPAR